jgi:hypothetical protein
MIRGLVYLVIFLAGFALGGVFPSFSAQYHQRLQAQFEQVDMDLAPFQEIANRFHGGSLDALIQHHLNSSDPTFYAEGEAIQLMIDSRNRLAESRTAAESGYLEQAVYLYRNRSDAAVQATWESFSPALLATETAISFALTVAITLLLAVWLLGSTLTFAIRRSRAAKRS